MKKTKQPGDNISLKTKKTEDPAVMQWINAQTNLMDSLRYLIEHEIVRHGVRNLQTFVPVERHVLGGLQRAAEQAQAGHGAAGNQPGGEQQRWFDEGAAQRQPERPEQTAQHNSSLLERPTASQDATAMHNGQQSSIAGQHPALQNGLQSPTAQQSPMVQQGSTAQQGPMVRQAPDALPGSRLESAEPSQPHQPVDDEIDDEDIDAWT